MKSILDEVLEKMPEEFNLVELFAKAEEKTPYVLVALQECERMNTLTQEMRKSLKMLDLGLKVCLISCHPQCQVGENAAINGKFAYLHTIVLLCNLITLLTHTLTG